MNNNLKLKLIYSFSVIIFSSATAFSLNSVIGNAFKEIRIPLSSRSVSGFSKNNQNSIINWDRILNSGFFVNAEPSDNLDIQDEKPAPSSLRTLKLIGTITGDSSYAIAIIRNSSTGETNTFKRWKDVYGYQLIRINDFTVTLKSGNQTYILDMYEDETNKPNQGNTGTTNTTQKFNKTISRSSILQETKNNPDEMLKGLRIGPYRENGKVVGYKLYKVSPTNMLFRLGARSGDVIRRINGHPIDSTQKLFQMWQNFTKETKFVIDLQRGNTIITYDFTITD